MTENPEIFGECEKEGFFLSWKESAARLFDIPEEGLGSARIVISGRSQVTVEQVSGILDYTPTLVRVKTPGGMAVICGQALNICRLEGTVIRVSGHIDRVEL